MPWGAVPARCLITSPLPFLTLARAGAPERPPPRYGSASSASPPSLTPG